MSFIFRFVPSFSDGWVEKYDIGLGSGKKTYSHMGFCGPTSSGNSVLEHVSSKQVTSTSNCYRTSKIVASKP